MPLFTRKDREVVGTAGVVLRTDRDDVRLLRLRRRRARRHRRRPALPAGAVQVSLSEFAITPASISAPLNGKLLVTNAGIDRAQLQHPGHERPHQGPAARRHRDRRPEGPEGRAATPCSARSPGHQQAGMQATLVIGGGGGVERAGRHGEHGLQQHVAAAARGDERPDGRDDGEGRSTSTPRS